MKIRIMLMAVALIAGIAAKSYADGTIWICDMDGNNCILLDLGPAK